MDNAGASELPFRPWPKWSTNYSQVFMTMRVSQSLQEFMLGADRNCWERILIKCRHFVLRCFALCSWPWPLLIFFLAQKGEANVVIDNIHSIIVAAGIKFNEPQLEHLFILIQDVRLWFCETLNFKFSLNAFRCLLTGCFLQALLSDSFNFRVGNKKTTEWKKSF